MTPEDYDAWYDTPRGRWIGQTEWAMIDDALGLQPGDSVLDVGCGSGWFTRQAGSVAAHVIGLDIDPASVAFARSRSTTPLEVLLGDATDLPFGDASFDKVMSITALCFVADWRRAIAEIVRVTRDRFAIGLLNRRSLLYLRKGRHGGAGAYSGAHWHTRAEVAEAMRGLPVATWAARYGVFETSAGRTTRLLERVLPASCPFGGFLMLHGRRAPDPGCSIR